MPCCPFQNRSFAVIAILLLSTFALRTYQAFADESVDQRVQAAEAQRIAVIEKVKPSVVAIFARGGEGGGSGVLVTKDGFAFTNYHVVAGAGQIMQCGLPDGVLYDAVLVGLDKVGDVALIKLLPKEKDKDFPVAVMGDSDTVKAGDWSLAMGNPFLLATDFTPTVTFGLVSGIHRYQYPAGTLLEYTDCIQIDTSINPGNSGGPLFNMNGELIGINGRGSFDKRGRVNSGVGYAISINQIKNFMGHLKAGIDTDHATLGAVVETDAEESGGNQLTVKSVIDISDVHRRGLDSGDELVSFAGRPVSSTNQYKNVLGLYPKGWRVPLVYRRDNNKHEILVRLMQLQKQGQEETNRPNRGQPRPPQPAQPAPKIDPELAKLYEPKPGFANYYFNKIERDRLLADCRKNGDFAPLIGTWTLEAEADAKQKKSAVQITVGEEAEQAGKDGKPIVREWTYHLKVATLPALPVENPKDDQTALRKAVRKAGALLRQHANSFPQEIWAKDNDPTFKDSITQQQKEITGIIKSLDESVQELQSASKDREQEGSRLWQAHFDFALARILAFTAYANEYNHVLAQLVSNDPPKRDPKTHRGWRMSPQTKLQNSAAEKLATEAEKTWQKMTKDYEGTLWEERAREGEKLQLGLAWQPTGGTRTIVRLNMDAKYELDPLKVGQELQNLKDPPGSGGLMTALYFYRRFLTMGPSGFEGHFSHGGVEPFYPPPAGDQPMSFKERRIDTEVLATEHAAVSAKWYFSQKDHLLLGFEVTVDSEEDPCEVFLSDYRKVDGRMLPHRFEVRHGSDRYGVFTIKNYQLASSN